MALMADILTVSEDATEKIKPDTRRKTSKPRVADLIEHIDP